MIKPRVIFASALVLFISSPAFADTEQEPLFEAESYVRFIPATGVSAMSGRVQLTQAASEYSYGFKAFDKLPVEFSLATQYIGIKNTTRVSLPARLTRLSFGAETTLLFFGLKNTYWRTAVYPSFYSDNWNFDSSSFRIPVHTFAIYRLSDKWTYVLGVAVYIDFDDEAYPIGGFIYKPNDKLSFNILPDGPNITYILNEKFTLFTEFDACWNEFEVTRNNSKGVSLIHEEKYLGAGFEYKFNKLLTTSFSVGGVFGRALKYRDGEGKVAIKDGFYSEFRVNLQI